MGDTDLVVVLSALSLPHVYPQLRKLKSNLVLPVPTPSASPTILPAKKSITRKDVLRLSTNTAHTLDMLDLDMLMLDLSDMLSNVRLMLKLTHKFSVMAVMVDSTTDSGMPDMPTMPLLPLPSPPPSPRPSRLPALRSRPNIALMSQSSRRSSPPSRLATLSPWSPAHPLSTPSPRSLAKPELPKSWNTPSTPTMELTSVKHLTPKSKNCNLDK